MSAANNPFGFICAMHPSGQSRARPYPIATGYAANIFTGDPVKLVTAGTVQLSTSDGTRTGTVDGILPLGVFAGCTYTDAQGKPNWSPYWPASTTSADALAWVYDDPMNVYLVQADGSVAQAGLGDQADWTGMNTNGGGSTLTGHSTATLSSTLVGAGNQGNFRIIDFDKSGDNAAGDAFTKVLVQIAEHTYVAPKTAI